MTSNISFVTVWRLHLQALHSLCTSKMVSLYNIYMYFMFAKAKGCLVTYSHTCYNIWEMSFFVLDSLAHRQTLVYHLPSGWNAHSWQRDYTSDLDIPRYAAACANYSVIGFLTCRICISIYLNITWFSLHIPPSCYSCYYFRHFACISVSVIYPSGLVI